MKKKKRSIIKHKLQDESKEEIGVTKKDKPEDQNLNIQIESSEKAEKVKKDEKDISIVKNEENVNLKNYEYKKLRYKNNTYKVGDTIIVRDSESGDLVCKLIKIIPKEGDKLHPEWPMIEVLWYYRKEDIDLDMNKITKELSESIADNELFETNHKDRVFADCIVDHCRILPFHQYELDKCLKSTDYFFRSFYDIQKKVLNPPFSSWEKVCICQRPANPNLLYVLCDKCNRCFHPSCMGLDEKKLDDIPNFYCNSQDCKEINFIEKEKK